MWPAGGWRRVHSINSHTARGTCALCTLGQGSKAETLCNTFGTSQISEPEAEGEKAESGGAGGS